MRHTQKQNRAAGGFTIIETLFVLAIAGIILVMVFLAVPQLQRSSRNDQRRQDVQTVLQFVSRYELNNSGDMPTTTQFQDQNISKLTFYDTGDITLNPISSADAIGAGPHTNDNDVNTIKVYNYQRCGTDGNGTNTAAGYTDIVALYALELSNGSTPQCQQL